MMIESLIHIIYETIIKKAVSSLWLRITIKSSFNTRRKYLSKLRNSILEMPLLYRGVKMTIESDFVDISIIKLDNDIDNTDDGIGKAEMRSSGLGAGNVFSKLIIFGNAGIGKTTLFRRAALEIIEKSKSGSRLVREAGLVPVFVPLKAISNHSLSPILNYVFATQSYFSGVTGKLRFKRMARSRKIYLLLDGYDEIPYIGGVDYIKSELNLIMGKSIPVYSNGLFDDGFKDIYKDLQYCRVWLSSRFEFYKTYPLSLANNVGMIRVSGLSNNGIALVGRLFSYYRNSMPDYVNEQLDEENFMRELLIYGKESLIDIMHSPLFLTVICHTYVNDLFERRPPVDAWKKGAGEVINNCIKLLISDIDHYKTADLPPKTRRALIERRSSWPNEKMIAIRRIALESYRENKSLLSTEEIEKYCRNAISEMHQNDTTREILRGLGSFEPSIDLAVQIRFSGILVRVRGYENTDLYDFPHRRFRELLAVQELDSVEGALFISENWKKESFSQLVLLYMETATHKTLSLKYITNDIIEHKCSKSEAILFAYILQKIDNQEDLHNISRDYLLSSLKRSSFSRLYVKSIIKNIDIGNIDFCNKLFDIFKDCVLKYRKEHIAFIYPILISISKFRVEQELMNIYNSTDFDKEIGWSLCQILNTASENVIDVALVKLVDVSKEGIFDKNFCRFLSEVWLTSSIEHRRSVESKILNFARSQQTMSNQIDILIKLFSRNHDLISDERDGMVKRLERNIYEFKSDHYDLWINEEIPQNLFRS